MSKKIEYRAFKTELRVMADKPCVEGYAAVYNVSTDLGGGYRESVNPAAFARALQEKQDVRGLFNHDANMVLGRTKSGTLRLSSDNTGLHFECDLNEADPEAMSVRAKIMRGDVDQCSFAFGCVQDQVTYNDDGSCDRELMDADLYDVSPVTYPAYDTTSCEARSVAAIRSEIIERRAKEIEKRLSPDELATLRLRVNVAFRGL
jgi:HK97 family phage prohead protease